MAADTACTIILADSDTPLLLEQPTPFGITITSASHHSIKASSKGHLPFNLPAKATECHRVPKPHAPLLSVGQVCDSSCTAIFTSTKMHLLHNKDVNIKMKDKPIFTGTRAPNDLWIVSITTSIHQTSTHLCNSAYTQANTKPLTLFLHASLGTHQPEHFSKPLTTASSRPFQDFTTRQQGNTSTLPSQLSWVA